MSQLFIWYPKCTTCKKAKDWLQANAIDFQERDIKTCNPTVIELRQWYKLSGLPLKSFFNTSGLKYKELQLKDKLATLSEQEQLELLASDGMLVKRPLLIAENLVLVGFKEVHWQGLKNL